MNILPKLFLISTLITSYIPHMIYAQVALTTAPKVEDITFTKYTAPKVTATSSTQTKPAVRLFSIGDIVGINITSQKDPTTPIDIFILPYTADETPTKRLYIKTVFNEEQGKLKSYSLRINQDLINEIGNAASMRIGYCVNGCRENRARMIPGKIMFSNTVRPTTPLGTQQTF